MNGKIKNHYGTTFYAIAIFLSLSLLTLNITGCGSSNSKAPNVPIADAGIDQHIKTGSIVTLDGSASSGAALDDQLTYNWIMTTTPSGSGVTLSGADTSHPNFSPDLDGDYVIELTVNDGTGDSAADTVTITVTPVHVNATPVANAGPDQHIKTGITVLLDGSASSDADHNPLTYRWTIESRPENSNIVFDDTVDTVKPTFAAFSDGVYVIKLIVNDGKINSAPVTVTITATTTRVNAPPVANAGPAQTVNTGTVVTLDGSASSDADHDSLTYSWTLQSKPSTSSSASLNAANTVSPTITPDVGGNYVIKLIVNDGKINSAPVTVTITATTTDVNAPPVASAGPDQHIKTSSLVTLDGSASSGADPDDLLTYNWIMTAPPGSGVTLSRADTSHPNFSPDLDGDYVIELTVIDGAGDSAADTVTITATSVHVNAAPVANAGPDQHDKAGSIILLDGSKSTDADHDPLTYHWVIKSIPVGADLSDILFNDTADPVKPTFILFGSVYGDYVFELIVNDATEASAPDTVTITITSRDVANATPVANAGMPQHVKTGTLVTLDGSKSTDADPDTLTYHWTLAHKPANSTASLSATDQIHPKFTADLAGTYLINLVVNDGTVDSAVSSVGIFAEASILVGIGSRGGIGAAVGTIQGIDISGGPSQPLFSFPGAPTPGGVNTSGLTRNTANGLLYGLLGGGGSYSGGAIFSYDPATGNIVTLYSFSDKDGTDPLNAPAISSDGVLYGTTNKGGQHDYGTLFSYTIADDSFKVLKDFTRDVTGHTSRSTPLVASSGTVYGTLSGGIGVAKGGTFWSYTPSSDSTTIGPFEELGRTPTGSLYLPGGPLVEYHGKIHFAALGDGFIHGAHFYWDPSTRQLHSASIFQGGNTSFCFQAAGVAVSNNSLFLYCQSNDDNDKPVIVKVENVAPDGSTDLIAWHNFGFETTGTFTHLIDAGQGHLYASFASEFPKIYRVSATGPSASVVFTYPLDVLGTHAMKLIAAHEGKIYGISRDRGTYREGQVYTYDTNTDVLNTTSLGYPNVTNPTSGMAKHSNGKLYGFAPRSLFEFDPNTRAIRSKRLAHGFYDVRMRAVEGAGGTLYAIATEYGERIKVVSINPTNFDMNSLKVIETTVESADFTSRPIIVRDETNASDQGKLYGLSEDGSGVDKLFEYDIEKNSSTTVYTFPNGEEPVLGVTHVNGKLYGTTATGGGSSQGSIYALNINGTNHTVLHNFSGTDGETPSSVLLLAKDGLLYGTTSAGGDNGMGTLFSIDLSGSSFTTVHHFDNTELTGAGRPSGVLTQASDGKIYGAAYTDGTDSEVDGIVFAYDPVADGLTVVQRANGTFGFGTRYPEFTEVILRGGL